MIEQIRIEKKLLREYEIYTHIYLLEKTLEDGEIIKAWYVQQYNENERKAEINALKALQQVEFIYMKRR